MKTKEKYEYYKEKYPNSIILIKEGIFYKTYKEDAIIIWNLFHYKWNQDCISFGSSPYSKVVDELNRIDMSYVVIAEEETFVPNDEKVYPLYVGIASIAYQKNLKRVELHQLLDKILNQNFDNSDVILSYFQELENKKL